ncbi:MAG: DEAD/DEAH box helicase [Gammaproteobacteria bacterium]|nr:DEAD/DEAH box helicase [Gammaproteobacteria bacterium]MCP5425458.1 DEAD/DEAH box helicase [Gammaproteobacteria bacterium]
MSSPDFATLGVAPAILQALQELGYEQPSPIQAQSIPLLARGSNLLGTAQTGTGKTAAFALPLLSRLRDDQQTPQILVLTPTRELAIQVAEAFKSYARYLPGFNVLPIYGGQDMRTQLRALRRGVQVVVGTPGRILDHLGRRSLVLDELQAIVLDEADEMLRMGFIDDVQEILAATPAECQRALFSATMPAAIRQIATEYLGNPQEVRIAAKTTTVERTEQRYLLVHDSHKLDALTRILEVEPFDAMIIFVRTKSSTMELATKLEARGFAAEALNGDLSQELRERTVERLRRGELDILVATDVAARGLDIERISHVFNYDIPYDTEAYVHRIGRTGRAGREGKAILFVAPKEHRLLKAIERATRQPLTAMELPSSKEISDQRIRQFRKRLTDTLCAEDLSGIRELLENLADQEELNMADVAAALAFQLQKEQPLFPVFEEPAAFRKSSPERRPRSAQDDSASPVAMVCYQLAVGRRHNVMPKDIVGAIANEAAIDSRHIGRINLYDDHSTVELPKDLPKEALRHLQSIRIRQHPIQARLISTPAGGGKPTTPRRSGGERRRKSAA